MPDRKTDRATVAEAPRKRGGQPRTGKPSRYRLVTLLDSDELRQLDAYVARYGKTRATVVREALTAIGALKA